MLSERRPLQLVLVIAERELDAVHTIAGPAVHLAEQAVVVLASEYAVAVLVRLNILNALVVLHNNPERGSIAPPIRDTAVGVLCAPTEKAH